MNARSIESFVTPRGLREVSTAELTAVDGGKIFLDVRMFGYELTVGDGGIAACGPENCYLLMWSDLLKAAG